MARIDTLAIARKAWEVSKRHRFLWGLGILAGSEGASLAWQGDQPASDGSTGRVQMDSLHRVTDWISAHPTEVQAILATGLVILLALIYVSLASKAGLIVSVNSLEEKGEQEEVLTFSRAFSEGRHYVWRLLGIGLLLGLMLLASVLILVFLLVSLSKAGPSSGPLPLLAGVFSVVLLMTWVPWAQFSDRAAVLGGYGVTESIRRGWGLLTANIGASLMVAIGSILASLVLGIGVALVIVCVGLVGLGAGFGAYALIHVGSLALAIAIALGAVFVVISLAASGLLSAFASTYWTFSYRALAYLALEKGKK